MSETKCKHETICIECRYQCSKRCSWAWEFVPVDGWTAVETKTGYDVYACPNFVQGRGLPRAGFDTDGVIACLHAALVQTREDYIVGYDTHDKREEKDPKKSKKSKCVQKKSMADRLIEAAKIRAENRKRIENWLRGDGQKLMMLSDPEAVIQQLRIFARKYEAERALIDRSLSRGIMP